MISRIFTFFFVSGWFLFAGTGSAQTTGSFDKNIPFGSGTRTISYYVPGSYNAANKYKLIIGLHGLGGNPQSMRTVLQQSAVSSSGSPVYNAIVVCPDGGSDDDFLTPSSDTGIVTAAMKDAMLTYNIDPEQVYLNGISLGGRAALRYGLINWWRFKGLELWCPAIQTMSEANSTSFYPYQNSKYIPITFTVGSEDGYVQNGKIPAAMAQIANAGSKMSLMQIVYGMGHQQPPSSYIYAAYDFIHSNASSYALNDSRISAIPSPFDEICVTAFTPTVTIQNKGKNVLTSATISYQLDGGPVNTVSWTGSLNRLGSANVALPAQTVSAGSHVLNAYTTMPNGVADAVPSNDACTKNFQSLTSGATSLAEGFQGATFPPAGWAQGDKVWMWEKMTGLGAGGSTSCVRFDNYTDWNRVGKKYQFRTAMYDFSASTAPVLTYDYSYALDNQDPQKGPDTLVVLYSDDCGSTWNELLQKGGATLATAPSVTGHFVPSSSQWQNESVSLNSLAGKPRVMFAFECHHNWGNLFYLDNVTLTGVTGMAAAEEENDLTVYPNPSAGQFTLQSSVFSTAEVEVVDVMGRKVSSLALEQGSLNLDLTSQPNGIYFLRMKTEAGLRTEKVVISR